MVRYWKDGLRLRGPIDALFAARSLEEQRRVYETQVRGRLWTPAFSWLSCAACRSP